MEMRNKIEGMNMEMTTGCCWNCSTDYAIEEHHCPECEAINPNVDLQAAMDQMNEMCAEALIY
jgi:hypothetical protein